MTDKLYILLVEAYSISLINYHEGTLVGFLENCIIILGPALIRWFPYRKNRFMTLYR